MIVLKKKKEFALALRIDKWKGILGNKNSPENHVRMGKELADYAKRAGMRGIMHSDELPAHGIDGDETDQIKRFTKGSFKRLNYIYDAQ